MIYYVLMSVAAFALVLVFRFAQPPKLKKYLIFRNNNNELRIHIITYSL